MSIWPKLPFEISKIVKISKFTKISKVSQRHETFFLEQFSSQISNMGSELKNKTSIKPVDANLSIFGTFARTYPITLKFYQNIDGVIPIKNHEKNWQYLWPFSLNCHLKSKKLPKFQFSRYLTFLAEMGLFSCSNLTKINLYSVKQIAITEEFRALQDQQE